MSSAAASARRSHVPALVAGPAWWPLAAGAAALTALAGMRSLQLGCALGVSAIVLGVYAYSRRWGVIALWLAWLLLPFVRRLFGLTGFVNSDPLAALPFLLTGAVAAIELVRGPVSRRAWLIIGAALAGFLIGLPTGLAQPSRAAFAYIAYAAGVLAFGLGYREKPRDPTLPRVLLMTVPVLSVYGIVQYFGPLPRWDSTWISQVNFVSAGSPEVGHVRAWSTLNAPATFATVLGIAIIVYLVARRFTPWRAAGLVLAATALALTYVRGTWIAIVAGLIAVIAATRGRSTGRIVFVLALIVLAVPLLAAGTGTGHALISRFQSLFSLGQDTSAQQRLDTPRLLVPIAVNAPLGIGLGSAGEATRLGEGGLRSTDNALLALILQVGPVGFLLVMGAIVAGLRAAWYNAWRSTRRGDALVIALLAFLCTEMFAADILYGITGVIMWYLLGMAVARYEAWPGARG